MFYWHSSRVRPEIEYNLCSLMEEKVHHQLSKVSVYSGYGRMYFPSTFEKISKFNYFAQNGTLSVTLLPKHTE